MGISANQARLMTLTARQHDLELRAQQISAEKMIKSLNSQRWAMEYSEKLNLFTQQQQGLQPTYLKEVPTPVTEEWLFEKGYYVCNNYGNLSNTQVITRNPDLAQEYLQSGRIGVYKFIPTDSNTPTTSDFYRYYNANASTFAPMLETAYLQNANISLEEFKASLNNKGINYAHITRMNVFQLYYESPKDDGTCAGVKVWVPAYSTDPSTAIDIDPAIIEQITGYSSAGTRYMYVLVEDRPAPTLVEVPYDELDINIIKAEYDAAVSSLTADEKLLDMELTQINTEHKAVKTEYDSVKGLVGENVDKSFNVFG